MGAQRTLTRRSSLAAALGLVALISGAGCRKRDRASVLEALAREVVGVMVHDVLVTSSELDAALRSLAEAPSPSHHAAARNAFKPCALAWKRAYAFRAGPLAESHAFQRATFWPVPPSGILAVLSGSEVIDERCIEGLGVEQKGIFALEFLLFDVELARLGASSREVPGERARRYAREASGNVLGYARRVSKLLHSEQDYAAIFARDGQSSVAQLVVQVIDSVEILSGKLIRLPRAQARHDARWSAVEGFFSGLSLEVALALLTGTRQLYLGAAGGGLSTLVNGVSPAIDQHVRTCLDEADRSLRVLGGPIELALEASPAAYQAALRALAALQHTLKLEMASALEL